MFRRFSAALIGLALCLPVFAVPVAAHGPVSFTVDFDEQADDDVVGTVTNHTLTRATNVQVTATWDSTVDIVASGPIFISNLAPHNASPFHLDTPPAAEGLPLLSVTASGSGTSTFPTAGLKVAPGTFATDVYTGSVTNEGTVAATNVRVSAVRESSGTITDAKESALIATIAAGDTVNYVITFEAGTLGTVPPLSLIAKTNTGAFHTSWNNFFGDLGGTSVSFVDDIAFMADEGITTGCGNANYCPKSNVTRAQMAVFLTRALGLTDFTDAGFTDIGTQSQTFQDAINAVANGGITSGCGTNLYCPNSSVTRGQMSKFIVIGYGLAPIAGDGPFTDDNGHFSESYNNRMAENGITTGCGTSLFCPNSAVNREQMAVFINRAENPS